MRCRRALSGLRDVETIIDIATILPIWRVFPAFILHCGPVSLSSLTRSRCGYFSVSCLCLFRINLVQQTRALAGRPMLVSQVAIIFIHPSNILDRRDTYEVLEIMCVDNNKKTPINS